MENRERAPQEVTPVRIEASRAALPRDVRAPRDAAARETPARESAHVEPATAPDVPPTAEEIAHDATSVRRRALATAAYGAGAIVAMGSAGFAGSHASPSYVVSAATVALFCGIAAVAGTVWTWAGARRLGDVGISVFDAIDGAWRDVAARRALDAPGRRGALARPAARGTPASSRPAVGGGSAGARAADVHRVPASAAVLQGRWGATVTQAVDDRAALAHLVAGLGPADRDMIPDVLPTADTLLRRVGDLATTLHELDQDAPASLVADVEARLAAARSAAAAAGRAPDHDVARRIELLERQHATLADLALRREQLATRLDGAALLLQNMRLDLLRLRSAGIESALGELTSATREAGALSRDIATALDVAEELRKH
jgi:hypothetical protein